LLFCCIEPADEGGETPLAHSRSVLKRLDQSLAAKFEKLGVRYTQRLHGGNGFGRSWSATFDTTSRNAVEHSLREQGARFRWMDDGGLEIVHDRPAVIAHPATHERVWFNQAEQWHPSSLPDDIRADLVDVLGEAGLPHDACFGDGTPFLDEELDEIRSCLRAEQTLFKWEPGDVLLLDNVLVAHGRRPFQGSRRVIVTMM
jgi:alpha-ketoglutarate-dependent taurine dioxygenase